MKRITAVILALVMCLSLCACQGNTEDKKSDAETNYHQKATIVTNEGETVELSAQDLFDEYDANEARFTKLYTGATIEFIGTVKSIKIATYVPYGNGKGSTNGQKIVFEEGWCLILSDENTTYDLADYSPGEKLRVSTGIINPAFDTESAREAADNNRVVWLIGNDYNINSQLTTIVVCGEDGTPINPSTENSTDESQSAEETVEHLNIGETAKTDIVELTVNNVQYVDTLGLDSDNWLKPTHNLGGLGPGEGNVFVWFDFSAKNISKEDLSGYDVCNATVDYNNGYIYDSATYTDGMYGWSTVQGLSRNVGLTPMAPLATQNYYGCIPCVAEVRSNQEAPVSIIFSLPSTTGSVNFAFDLYRAENGVDPEIVSSIISGLNQASDSFGFVQQYAGNVTPSGSRAFADSFIDGLRSSLDAVDIAVVENELPEAYEMLISIQERIDTVCDLLVDMGKTNSDKNVQKMKDLSGEAINMIDELFDGALAGY